MKSVGIVRKIDDLGRMVIPKELRNRMDIKKKDPVEIFVEGDKIVLKKYIPGCVFCGDVNNNSEYKGKVVCEDCREDI